MLKEARRIPEEILGKVSIAVSAIIQFYDRICASDWIWGHIKTWVLLKAGRSFVIDVVLGCFISETGSQRSCLSKGKTPDHA